MTASMLQILGDEICDAVYANQERGLVTEFALKSLSEYTEAELDEYGYAGLVQIGFTPQQARNRIASRVDGSVLATFRRMNETTEGREQLAKLAEDWRKDGVEPPWE